jgi:metallo-beta-lactamase family protein
MDITSIFQNYGKYFDQEAQAFLKKYNNLFNFPLLKFTPDTDESKAINEIRGTTIIMAGSGMCTGGRIKHHLANNIFRPESTILFVGYQAVGTLGRVILDKVKRVRILGQVYNVKAKIEKINGFSAHADQAELLRWEGAVKPKPKKIFIVHSEGSVASVFARRLEEQGCSVSVAQYLQDVNL